MAATLIGHIGDFVEGEEEFCLYQERFEQFLEANAVKEEKKIAIFLSVIGPTCYKLLRNLLQPDLPSTKTYAELTTALSDHYKPKPITIAERFRFHKRNQACGESISSYVVELKRLASSCNFRSFLDEAIRDRIVCGIRCESTQKRLLSKKELKLSDAVEIAQAMELADKDTTELKQPESSVMKVKSSNFRSRSSSRNRNFASKSTSDKKKCYRCGRNHDASVCKFQNATCHKCGKLGHISPVCRSKAQSDKANAHCVTFDEDTFADRLENKNLFTVANAVVQDKFNVPVAIEGVKIQMVLDTAADVSTISEDWIKCNLPKLKLSQSHLSLNAYNGSVIDIIGEVLVNVKYRDDQHSLPLIVVRGNHPALFGRNWIEKIKLDWGSIFAIKQTSESEVTKLLEEFKDLGTPSISPIKHFKASIKLKDDATLVFCKARTVPYSLLGAVEKQIKQRLSSGVWERVEHSRWATPIVHVLKSNGDVRICGDFKITVNPQLHVTQYPLPLQQDLFATLNGGQEFTTLDCTNAYEQVELDEKSQEILTLNTHMGLMRPKRLVFGIASVAAIFQSIMDQVTQGLGQVVAFQDDTLATAPNHAEHIATVRRTLERFRKYNVKLNLKKCKILQPTVTYLGHRITAQGIHPTDDKVRAILGIPPPQNVADLQSYLGALNYYNKFLVDRATKLAPLYKLLCADTPWHWDNECNDAFLESKKMLTSDAILVHYDPKKPLLLACDASNKGLGAILSHRMPNGDEKMVSSASRTLTAAEKNYSQTDKEALAIMFGVKYFSQYLLGRHFTLITDHKPLVAIFGPKCVIPILAAERLRRWAIHLSSLRYDIIYKPGKHHQNADALSRNPLTEPFEVETLGAFKISYAQDLTVDAHAIKQATRTDPILGRVYRCIRNGWPEKVEPDLKPFYSRRDELSLDDDCITWGLRIVIPTSLQCQLLDILHDTHPGITKMKAIARSYMWWPGLDADVEKLSKACDICQRFQPDPIDVVMQPWVWPQKPWERVHIDFAEFDKRHYLIIYDAYSKWIDVQYMSSTTALQTIEVLRCKFALYGIPREIVSDNGPPFTSHEFKNFLKLNGVRHTLVPAYHPSSNGAAERAVKTFKIALRKMVYDHNDKSSLNLKIQRFLMYYRSTPHATTGVTPAELFIGRKFRTVLDSIIPDVRAQVEHKQFQQSARTGRVTNKRFHQGQSVWIRQYSNKNLRWIRGTIETVQSSRTYIVKTNSGRRTVHVDQMRPDYTVSIIPPDDEPKMPDLKLEASPKKVLPDVETGVLPKKRVRFNLPDSKDSTDSHSVPQDSGSSITLRAKDLLHPPDWYRS